MASMEEIMIFLKGTDQTAGMFGSVQSKLSALKVAAGAAATFAGAAVLSFAKDSVNEAISAEQGWNTFNAAVQRVGGNIDSMHDQIISAADNLHRSTGDIRTAAADYMNYGASAETAMQGVAATSAIAAAKNIDFSTAESYVMSALKGRGGQLKSLGIDISNYKDSTTGAVDTTRLFNDVLAKFGSSQDLYNGSAAAQIQDYETGMARLKTAIGQGLLPVLQTFVPLITALTNAFSNAPGSVKTIVSVLIGLGATLGVLAGPIMMIQGAFGGLIPTITSIGGSLVGLTSKIIAFATSGEVISTLTTTFNGMKMAIAGVESAEIASAAAHASNGVAITAEGTATMSASTGFWAMAAAELAALWPIALIVAAILALIVAFEKVGEYFGWWKDFGTMLDSIRAGVVRLWEAFANSPQVQGTIRDITNAFRTLWSVLSPIVSPIINAMNKIFHPRGGNWQDPVGDIIKSFGKLGAICGNVVNAIKRIPQTLTSLPAKASQAVNGFIKWMVLLPVRVGIYLAQVVTRIIQFGTRFVTYMGRYGLLMLNKFISFIKQIPGQVANFFGQVAGNILNGLTQAVANAASFGSQVLESVMSFIRKVPESIYNEFANVGSAIQRAVSGAVEQAKNFGSQLWQAVLKAVGIASPGIIQRTILWEFQQTGERIPETYSIAKANAAGFGNELINGFNTGYNLMNKINNIPSEINTGLGGGNVTILNINEGAVAADMGNLNTKQSKQVLINALEDLGQIDYIVTK